MQTKQLFGEITKSVKPPGDDSEWELLIEARPSTEDVDRYGEITDAGAFMAAMPGYMKNPVMMFNHDPGSTIGKVLSYKSDDRGVIIEGGIAKTDKGREVATLIRAGIVKSMSFMFGNVTMEKSPDGGAPRLTKFDIYEIGPVTVPANPEALIEQAKKLDITLDALTKSPDGGRPKQKESNMDEKAMDTIRKCEKAVVSFGDSLDSVSGDVNKLQVTIDSQAKLLKQLEDAGERMKAGLMTQAEFDTFSKKIGEDILGLQKDLQDIRKAANRPTKIPVANWKMLSKDMVFLRDDDGKALSRNHQKGFQLFQLDIDLVNGDGPIYKALRDLNDVVVLCDAYYRARGMRYDITKLKSYQLLYELVGVVDPEFQKAMYSTGSGVGDEWVPTLMSSELYDLYRLESGLENLIPHFSMPSNPYTWPIKSSNPTMYLASEAASNNPNNLISSNLGTSNVTFTAGIFAARIQCSPELIEDSLIAMAPEFRRAFGQAMADGYESLLINGDNAATHQDNTVATLYSTTAPEVYEDGFRVIASGDSKTFDAASTTTDVGDATAAFTVKDLRYMRRMMGVMGRKPSECVYVVSNSGYYQIMNDAVTNQPGTYAAGSTFATGALERIDGCQLLVSDQISEDLTAAGIYDASDVGYTVGFCFNKNGFKVGERRGFTVEVEKNITNQQWDFVVTQRKSFQNMTASGQYPVALGYKILD